MKWTPKLGCQFSRYEHPNREQGVHEQLSEEKTPFLQTGSGTGSFPMCCFTKPEWFRLEEGSRGHPVQRSRRVGQDHIQVGLNNFKDVDVTIALGNQVSSFSHPYSKNHFLLLLNGVSCTLLCTLRTHRRPRCYSTRNTHLDPLALRPGALRHSHQPQPRTPRS